MTDLRQSVKSLRRPALLIRAARAGTADYRRERDLCRLMRVPSTPTPARAVKRLLEDEGLMDAARRTGQATYSVARHVELLIALIAEAMLLPRLVSSNEAEMPIGLAARAAANQAKLSGSAALRRAM